MKIKHLLNTCLLFFCLNLTAQTNESKQSALHISFFPPLSTHGMQASQYTNDFSFSIISGLSRNENGFAFASVSNTILNDARGFQMAGVSNYTGNAGSGMQFSGVTNIVQNDYSGFQFAGIANVADNVNGFQFAGVFNKARKVRGVQFAGILNIAEESDYPIGLINIIKKGEMSVGLSYNETGNSLVSFRSGGRVLYGIVGVGFNHNAKKSKFVTEGGFGAHIPVVSWFRINAEMVAASLSSFSDDSSLLTSFKLMPAFKVLPNLEIFGGPSISFLTTDNPENRNIFPNHKLWRKFKGDRMSQLYLGYTIGTQFIF